MKYTPPVSPGAAEYLAAQIEPKTGRNRYPLNVLGEQIVVDSPLVGRHQYRNIALAIAAAAELEKFGFRVTAGQVELGIRDTDWPGRFQLVPAAHISRRYNANNNVILDVAHNPAGAWALRSAISETYAERPVTLIFAALRDKAFQEMADILFPIASQVIVTQVDNPRAASTPELLHAGSRTSSNVTAEPNVAAALRRAFEQAPKDEIIVVTGSIFLVGATMKELGLTV